MRSYDHTTLAARVRVDPKRAFSDWIEIHCAARTLLGLAVDNQDLRVALWRKEPVRPPDFLGGGRGSKIPEMSKWRIIKNIVF